MNSTVNIMYCGLNSNASIKWKRYFHELRFGMNYFTIRCLFSELIPTGATVLFNSYIVYHLIQTWRHLHQSINHESRKEQTRTASWMNIVLILHSSLFLASFLAHITGHFTVREPHEAWWILLTLLINCTLNFYVYCLSGKAFRNEIRRFIRQLKILILQKLHIQQEQQPQQYKQRHNLDDQMNNCQVIIPLIRHRLNDFNEHGR